MGVDVSTSITIGCPRLQVSNFAGDPSNAPEWYVKGTMYQLHTPLARR